MSAHLTTYEVEVEVRKKGSERYRAISWFHDMSTKKKRIWVRGGDKVVRMFHQNARTPEQAKRKCEKYGRPIGVRKVNKERIIGDIGNLPLVQETSSPYVNAIAMDEMIWQKRNKRIKNRQRDKETY